MDDAIDREGDVLQTKGLAAGFSVGRLEVLSRAEQPIEGHDCDELDVTVKGAVGGIRGIQDAEESAQDGDVDRVGAAGRVIFFGEGFEEISE